MKPNIGSGDSGQTNILGGRRVAKNSLTVEALGAVDEAASAIGLARSLVTSPARRELLKGCQLALQKVAAEMAAAGAGRATDFDFAGASAAIEGEMERIGAAVVRPTGFVVPGDSPAEAALHLARALVRRAERAAVALVSSGVEFEAGAAVYLNRLSDLLFDTACAEAAGK